MESGVRVSYRSGRDGDIGGRGRLNCRHMTWTGAMVAVMRRIAVAGIVVLRMILPGRILGAHLAWREAGLQAWQFPLAHIESGEQKKDDDMEG